MYGRTDVNVTSEQKDLISASSALFGDPSYAELLFRTTKCLRKDQSTCFKPGDKFYEVSEHQLVLSRSSA